jgi:hypothetical protein
MMVETKIHITYQKTYTHTHTHPSHHSTSIEDPSTNTCGYLVEAYIHGPDVKNTYNHALKATKADAKFPGFRKGVVPPSELIRVKINAVTVRRYIHTHTHTHCFFPM